MYDLVSRLGHMAERCSRPICLEADEEKVPLSLVSSLWICIWNANKVHMAFAVARDS